MTGNYLNADRGDRLKPKRTHSRYWVLKSLTNTLSKILEEEFEKKDNLLDYGCGNKPYIELFINVFDKYIGADLAGNKNADIIIRPDGTLPLENNTFSCVLSSQVLEHVEDPSFYLNEAYRILSKDGKLILSTHGFWPYHPDPNDYWRWTSAGLKKIIEDSGFKIDKMYSILTLASIAIQFWQDATMYKVPRMLRIFYVFLNQLLMQFVDKMQNDKFCNNASVYVVVATKIK